MIGEWRLSRLSFSFWGEVLKDGQIEIDWKKVKVPKSRAKMDVSQRRKNKNLEALQLEI